MVTVFSVRDDEDGIKIGTFLLLVTRRWLRTRNNLIARDLTRLCRREMVSILFVNKCTNVLEWKNKLSILLCDDLVCHTLNSNFHGIMHKYICKSANIDLFVSLLR